MAKLTLCVTPEHEGHRVSACFTFDLVKGSKWQPRKDSIEFHPWCAACQRPLRDDEFTLTQQAA